jgi:hypothetical protein
MAMVCLREVKESSLVLRSSFAYSGVEATMHGTEPRRRENKGP